MARSRRCCFARSPGKTICLPYLGSSKPLTTATLLGPLKETNHIRSGPSASARFKTTASRKMPPLLITRGMSSKSTSAPSFQASRSRPRGRWTSSSSGLNKLSIHGWTSATPTPTCAARSKSRSTTSFRPSPRRLWPRPPTRSLGVTSRAGWKLHLNGELMPTLLPCCSSSSCSQRHSTRRTCRRRAWRAAAAPRGLPLSRLLTMKLTARPVSTAAAGTPLTSAVV